MLLNSGSGSEEPTTRAHLYSDPWDAVSGYAAGTLPRPFPAAPGPLLSPGGARVGGGQEREPESVAEVQENKPQSPAWSGGAPANCPGRQPPASLNSDLRWHLWSD